MDLLRFGQVFACHFVTIFVFDRIRTANTLCNLRPGQLLGGFSSKSGCNPIQVDLATTQTTVKALPVKKSDFMREGAHSLATPLVP